MLNNLVRNTTLNLATFGVSGVLGLLTSGWTVAAYGLHSYGIIAFAKNLVPAGLLGIIDMGVPDAAARLVAGAIARKTQNDVNQYVSATLLFGALCGFFLSVGLSLSANLVAPLLMKLDSGEASQFSAIVFWSGIAAFPLMVNQAAEGVLKGMNRFRAVRFAEVFANVLFAIAVYWITFNGGDYVFISYAFLVANVVRSIANGGWLLVLRRQGRWEFILPSSECRARIFESSSLLWRMKLTSTANSFLPLFLIAQMIGPAGVGIFDVLMRIPRLIKAAIGVTTHALIPAAAILEAKDDPLRLGRLGIMGTFLLLVAITPLITSSMMASHLVLETWLGTSFTSLAPWLALALAWPLLLATHQVGNAVLTVRVEALVQMNSANVFQLVLMLLVAVALTPWCQEKAFIIAFVASEVGMLPYRIWIYSSALKTSAMQYWTMLARIAAASIPALGVSYFVQAVMYGGAQVFIVFVAVFCLTNYVFLALFSTAQERRAIAGALLNLPFMRKSS